MDKEIPEDIIQQIQVTDIDRLIEIGSNIMTINGLDDLRKVQRTGAIIYD